MAKKRFRGKPRKLSGFITGALHPNVLRRMKVSEIDKNWFEVVGPLLAGKSSVCGIEGNELVVIACSSSVAQQIKMRAGTIISRVKAIWNIDISGLKVFVGRKERQKNSTHIVSTDIRIRPSKHEIQKELQLLENRLDDGKLARSIASLKATYRKRFGNGEKNRKSL